MHRRNIPWWVTIVGSGSGFHNGALYTQRHFLKTLDVREYRPLGTPIEFRFYQRYANHPNRQSGIQFLTHYNTHQRFRVKKDYIDYMHWGREQGQARLPHRHQRVAFDFDDSLHPTVADETSKKWFSGQDPTRSPHPDIASSYDPNKKLFSHPEHWNKMFSKRGPGEGDVRLNVLSSQSLLGPLVTQTDTQETSYFRMDTQGPTHGKVPGINAPFLGEFDRTMMQAMSRPLNKSHTLTGNDGRFSKTLFINESERDQVLSTQLAQELNTHLDRNTNAVYSKLTVLTAAQSGRTDYFCGGMDYETLAWDLSRCAQLRARASVLLGEGTKAADASTRKRQEGEAHSMLRDATRHMDRADSLLREHAALIWRAYIAPRPLMALVNGKCRGTGCGLALATKYCALHDNSEFIFDGPNIGLTPYGGMTRLLARPETSLKYPGLAEFVMLSGTSLFAGDALRLGWTDLYTTLPDMTYHIRQWFDASEHMHNDAVAWQLGHLLDTCFKMKDAHSSALERCAVTPIRARWIEDAFADQPSVEAILDTLGQMERVLLSDHHNTVDTCHATPFTMGSVAEGIDKLTASQLRYTLSPWDITPPAEEVAVRQAAAIFTGYVLERRGSVDVAVHKDREKLRRWTAQREEEYRAYTDLRSAPHPRHVYARLEGCENTLVDFEFTFDPHRDAAQVADADAKATATLDRLSRAILQKLGMPEDRAVEVGWYMPTLDTCPVRSDEELVELLHSDPGIEDAAADNKYPPIYFTVKRCDLYLSEWAYAVRHQLLMQSPYALKGTLSLLQEVRGDGSAEAVKSLSDALALEYKYFVRAMQRPDFYAVGQHTTRSAEDWESIKEELARCVHKSHEATRPLPDFEAVFERDVSIDGHTFALRPRWHPRTVQEVTEVQVAELAAPLNFEQDGVADMNPSVYCSKATRLEGMLDDAGGMEVVGGLGDTDAEGRPLVAPLVGNAHVPQNVNFYEMARHPWEETASSWRRDGFTEGSQAYFEAQYKEAEKMLHDEEGRGTHSYWPSKSAVEGQSGETDASALLTERLHNKLAAAERGVEQWARDLRRKSLDGKLDYKMELATQQEKIYDDEYYRWFTQPGQHPNPTGLLLGRKTGGGKAVMDLELESFLNNLTASAVAEPVTEGSEGDAPLDTEETSLETDIAQD